MVQWLRLCTPNAGGNWVLQTTTKVPAYHSEDWDSQINIRQNKTALGIVRKGRGASRAEIGGAGQAT